MMQDARVNANIQADLVTKLLSEVTKAKTDFPQITATKTNTEIVNTIRNNVSNTMNIESIQALALSINNSAEVNAVSGGLVDTVKVAQSASAIGKAINNMSGQILSELGVTNDSAGRSEDKTTSFIADIVGSVSNGVSNIVNSVSDAFGVTPKMVILFVIIVVVGYMLAMKQMELAGGLPMPSYGRPMPSYGRPMPSYGRPMPPRGPPRAPFAQPMPPPVTGKGIYTGMFEGWDARPPVS
jgi:hypothetical protein